MFLGFNAIGQDTASATTSKSDKCIPTKECAAKMGMTVAECKAQCKKMCAAKGTASETSVASAGSSAELGLEQTAETKLIECAKKSGMSVAECKAKCKGAEKTSSVEAETTKVAAASVEAVVESTSVDGKMNCKKGAKKCCKK